MVGGGGGGEGRLGQFPSPPNLGRTCHAFLNCLLFIIINGV